LFSNVISNSGSNLQKNRADRCRACAVKKGIREIRYSYGLVLVGATAGAAALLGSSSAAAGAAALLSGFVAGRTGGAALAGALAGGHADDCESGENGEELVHSSDGGVVGVFMCCRPAWWAVLVLIV
jgi:hypothetical protein